MTESSPLKNPPVSSNEAQGGSARDRLAQARRRTSDPARDDGSTEPATPPRPTAAAPEEASDDDDDEGDEDGGREGGAPAAAAAAPATKGRSPGRFGLGGLLKGRKRAAPADAEGGGEEEGGESGEEEETVGGGKRRDKDRKEARKEAGVAAGRAQVERTGPRLTAPKAQRDAQTALLYRPKLGWGGRSERRAQQAEREARAEGL